MTDLVLFDVDGTLIDSSHLILTAQELTAHEHGLVFPGREKGVSVVGMSLDLALAELYGLDPYDPGVSVTYKRLFQELRPLPDYEEHLFPGIAGALATVAGWQGATLGVATGKTMQGLNYVIAKHGWNGLFKTLQTADTAPSKPDPGMILQAMAAVGAKPERTVMIGDSVHDMRMARAAGAHAVAVDWGFQPSPMLVEAGAHVVARQASDLPDVIADLLRR